MNRTILPTRNSPHCEIDQMKEQFKAENGKLVKRIDQLEFHIHNMNKAMLEMAKALDSLRNEQKDKEFKEYMSSLGVKDWGL